MIKRMLDQLDEARCNEREARASAVETRAKRNQLHGNSDKMEEIKALTRELEEYNNTADYWLGELKQSKMEVDQHTRAVKLHISTVKELEVPLYMIPLQSRDNR